HIEKEYERLVLGEGFRKRQLLPARGRQLEIRSLIPDLQHLESLSTVENVPAGARDAADSITRVEGGLERIAHGQPPCSRTCRIVATQRDDVVGYLARDHSRG